jgi:threonine dehydrogenase-like Zn-dependent dehydrogenase/predicted dehydrogenase
MKQLFFQKGNVFLQDVPTPLMGENSVLVKVFYSFISSGTEIATLNASEKSLLTKFSENASENVNKIIGAVKDNGVVGTFALVKEKAESVSALGYSCAGQIIAVGNRVEKFAVGDYVACAGSGMASHAEFVSVPKNLVTKVSDVNCLKEASLTTIGAIAMQGVRRAKLNLGETVCILGLGLIGQITLQLAKLAGCKVFCMDIKKERLELAEKLGADYVFNANLIDVEREISFITSHHGVDATIITAASSSGLVIQQAMGVTRRKGRVVLVGDVRLDFDRDPFYSKEIDFLISCSYGPGRYDHSYEQNGMDYPYSYVRWTENRNMELFVELIEKKKIAIAPLISQVFGFDEAEKAYTHLKKSESLGVVLSYEDSKNQKSLKELTEELTRNSYKSNYFASFEEEKNSRVFPYIVPSGVLNVGFIGTGGFAKIKLLPMLSKNRDVEIHSVVDTDSTNLINIAKSYRVKRFTSDCRKIFTDDDVKMVVIATPHKYHFEQSIGALKSGKAVFVEKPAAVTFEQLDLLKNFFKINRNSLYCVDFNRSFAPFNLAIKDELKKRTHPLIIQYRMNSGFIPKTHWIQSVENGGRIIGEACHIFELFCFLTDSLPSAISVESLSHSTDDILSNDNVIISLSMQDGSCCSLIYSALGNSNMGKERMEIFVDGKSIVMHDYKELKGYGFPISFNKKSTLIDKGHELLISKFIKAAKDSSQKAPIPLERILVATQVSLVANKLALAGGGREIFSWDDLSFLNHK